MSTSTIAMKTAQLPTDVVDFTALHQATNYLNEALTALGRLFPSAHEIQVRLERDPEIRDDCHVVFDVRVAAVDVPDFSIAKRRWHEELFRICPAPLTCLFRLTLIRESR